MASTIVYTGNEFKIALKKWADSTAEKLDALARQVAQEVAQNVVEDTPVDTGFLRSSWQPSLNEPNFNSAPRPPLPGRVPHSGAVFDSSQAQITIAAVVKDFKAGDVFYMTNGANYGLFVEFGTSKMAGRFFVTANMKKIPQIVNRLAKELQL
ncbi:Bacteriophage HK97-gp10, putative tail-component [uncultured Caudovirales phage]|uniref:Bacteriophage HK97-gp10, putative tail-component n=1 Tax=uncultured Caudovirales phage TaxID=2100421 RepID=A0A6J5L8W7_9CAUD|nr:Bacteriophage HK97-gp10, putative tail-component [uncultured Caudovirales phage]